MNNIFETKLGRAYNFDCFDVMATIPDGCVDMILADLPYGTTQNKWDAVIPFEPMWKEFWRICKSNAAIVLTAQPPFDKMLGASQIQNLKYEWIWEKHKATGHLNCKIQPLKAHENILVFNKERSIYNPQMNVGKEYKPGGGKSKKDNYGEFKDVRENNGAFRYPRSIQNFVSESGLHPTQKPVTLFEYLIKTYTNPGELVFDPTAGSLTTAIAAENTGRRWAVCELETDYFKKGIARFETA